MPCSLFTPVQKASSGFDVLLEARSRPTLTPDLDGRLVKVRTKKGGMNFEISVFLDLFQKKREILRKTSSGM
jgi:hypothetical protein